MTTAEILELPVEERAIMAFREAVARMAAEHARLGIPLKVWKDGRVADLAPETVLSAMKRG